MANKFTKSVLERQAKEAKLHAKTAETVEPLQETPAPTEKPEAQNTGTGTAAEISQPETVIIEEPAEPATAPPPKPTRTAKSKAPTSSVDLNAFIIRDEGRVAKNKTFYLDSDVIDAIKRAAAAQKVTDSKLVNDIMKKILGV